MKVRWIVWICIICSGPAGIAAGEPSVPADAVAPVESTGETVIPDTGSDDKVLEPIRMDEIVIPTETYKQTKVMFNHSKHARTHAESCEICHPAIKPVYRDESNQKTTVHETCKACHASGKPAKSFRCSVCHIE
ncbi:hypothetical protein JXA40_08580 [bacterium]|nr:hypothetical protein [candidate division CSSED10-310 bacterium]